MSPNQYVSDLRAERDALRAKVARVVEQCEADLSYYGQSDDPMAMGRVIGVREVLHVLGSTDSDPAATERQGEAGRAGDHV